MVNLDALCEACVNLLPALEGPELAPPDCAADDPLTVMRYVVEGRPWPRGVVNDAPGSLLAFVRAARRAEREHRP